MSHPTPPWETLSRLIAVQNGIESAKFIDTLSPPETARAVSRLTEAEQAHLFNLLRPEDAADLIEDIPEAQAADLVADMPSTQAAAIMEALTSDHLVDVPGEMDPAQVSSPLLTTVTDMCGFFLVLSFAAAVLPRLGGI
jgi:magnesium transporter